MQIYQGATDLDGAALARVDLEAFLHHDEGAKLAEVVKQEELIVHEFDLRVVARHRDIIHSQVLV